MHPRILPSTLHFTLNLYDERRDVWHAGGMNEVCTGSQTVAAIHTVHYGYGVNISVPRHYQPIGSYRDL